MPIRQLTAICALFAICAAALEMFNAFYIFESNAFATETLYIATDISLLFAWLGWHLHHHDKVGKTGFFGFMLAFIGTAFIVGPSAEIGGISAYTLGTPVISLGILLLSCASLYHQSLPKIIPAVFLLAVLVGLSAQFLPTLQRPVAYANLCMGLGLFLLGKHVYQTTKTKTVDSVTQKN